MAAGKLTLRKVCWVSSSYSSCRLIIDKIECSYCIARKNVLITVKLALPLIYSSTKGANSRSFFIIIIRHQVDFERIIVVHERNTWVFGGCQYNKSKCAQQGFGSLLKSLWINIRGKRRKGHAFCDFIQVS